MKTNRQITSILAGALLLTTGVLSSCGSDEEMVNKASPPSPAYVEGIYNGPVTRANSNQALTSFSLYVFDEFYGEGGEMQADNILWTLDPDTKAWSGNEAYYMSDWAAMYGYGVSPNTDDVTDPVFDLSEQSFTYTNPTEKGVLLKVASKLYFTQEETHNSLIMTFNDALYTLHFQAISGFQNVRVEVQGVTIHNVPNQARFTFSSFMESSGRWVPTADNQYVSASQTLPSAVSVSETDFADIDNEPFVLFPIQPEEWDFWGGESFTDMQARNCCYIEVKMRIIEEKNGNTYYQWGYADDDPQGREPFESAFYPYEQLNCTADWEMRYNGYYYLFLDDNCVDKNGNKMVPHPEEGGSTQFSVSSQIDFRTWLQSHGGTADQWGDDDEQGTVNVTM